MKISEIYSNSVSQQLASHIGDGRNKKLTLRSLNKLKKLRALKDFENRRRQDTLGRMYSVDSMHDEDDLAREKQELTVARARVGLERETIARDAAAADLLQALRDLGDEAAASVQRLAFPIATQAVRR